MGKPDLLSQRRLAARAAYEPPTEYRAKTEPPSEPGWYYARRAGWNTINPVLLCDYGDGAWGIEIVGYEGAVAPPDQWDWFGPVATVKEG